MRSVTWATSAVEPCSMVPAIFLPVVLHADRAHAEHADMLKAAVGRDDVGQGAKSEHLVEVELFAGQHLGGGAHADHGHMEYPEHVGAQRTDPVVDAIIQAADDRRDGDDGGYADDDAEDGQSRAQLVGPQRRERHLDRFACLSLRHGLLRNSCQSTVFSPQSLVFSSLTDN